MERPIGYCEGKGLWDEEIRKGEKDVNQFEMEMHAKYPSFLDSCIGFSAIQIILDNWWILWAESRLKKVLTPGR